MAQQIGTLAAKIVADTSTLEGNVKEAGRLIDSLRAPMDRLGSDRGGPNFLGIPLVIDPLQAARMGMNQLRSAAAEVSQQVGEAFERIQSLGNAAQSLGLPVADFQALTVAAANADVEIDVLKRGIYQMQKDIGSGSASGALEKLGLSLADIRKLAPEEQFRQISARISELKDPTEKVAVIADLFGKAGLEMTRLFSEGGDAVNAAYQQVERMGGAITDLDVAKINGLDTAWKEFNGTVDALWNELTIKLAPVLTDLLQTTTAWLQDSANQEMLTAVMDQTVAHARALLGVFKEMLGVLDNVAGKIKAVSGATSNWKLLGAVLGAGVANFGTPASEAGINDAAKLASERRAKDMAEAKAAAALHEDEGKPFKGIDLKVVENEAEKEAQKIRASLKDSITIIEEKIENITQLAKGEYLTEEEAGQAIGKLMKELEELAKTPFDKEIEAFRKAAVPESQRTAEYVAKLKQALDLGKLTEEEFDTLMDQEAEKLAKGQKAPQRYANAALTAGSQAAIDFLAQQKYGGETEKQTFDRMRKSLDVIAKNTSEPIKVEEVAL